VEKVSSIKVTGIQAAIQRKDTGIHERIYEEIQAKKEKYCFTRQRDYQKGDDIITDPSSATNYGGLGINSSASGGLIKEEGDV
jgi:hypothetical protein